MQWRIAECYGNMHKYYLTKIKGQEMFAGEWRIERKVWVKLEE
jgi:hypothetical protein